MIAERNRRVEDLVVRFGDTVRARAEREGWSEGEAEDLLQEVVVLLLRRWGDIEFPEAWLLEVARRQSIMGFRKIGRRKEDRLEDLQEATQLRVESFEEAANARVDSAARLRRLPERARRAITRRYLFGDTVAEASRRAGYSQASFGHIRLKAFARMKA